MSGDISPTPREVLSQETSGGVAVDIAQIWEQRKEAIVGRVDLLEEAVAGLLTGDLPQDLRRTAEREAHKLAGSLGTFGFSRGSSLAREMEAIFERADHIAEADVLRLSSLVTELRDELERPPARHPMPPRPPTSSGPGHPLLLVVTVGAELRERLSEEAGARALRIETASTLSGARRAIEEQLPQAVLLDLDVEPDAQHALALLRELTARHPRLPVITCAARAGLEERVQAARLGARLFLEKPLSPARVFDAVAELFDELDERVPKVMAVGDDLYLLAALRTLLESEGIELDTLDDPQRFWDVLSRAEPDLVVFDVDMATMNGIELCRVIRNDPRWRRLPVVFLTKKTDPLRAREVFAAGADDYLEKPLVSADLAARRGRLERLQLYSRAADTDGLTGIASRAQTSQTLDRFVYLADRYRECFGIALIDVDGLGQVNERHGGAAGDEVLRKLAGLMQQSFRGEDVAGRWSREEFLMGMYGLTREDGVQRMTELLARFRSRDFSGRNGEVFHVTFSSGLAIYPDDARSVDGLYQRARDALHKAKELGRNRVVAAGWRADQPVTLESADVVVVEDDETLAALLTHSLATQGYKVHRFHDGQEAAASLAASSPTVRGHVVLLDVDLPGLSGLDALRQLARAGVLQKTRVIMLTARAAESEVLEAMELGAIDHVAKPFSIPILLQRVRRSISQ